MTVKAKHLHPLALVIFLVEEVKTWWVLLLLGVANQLWWWLVAAVCVGVFFIVSRYATLTYTISADEIMIKQGLFNKQQLHLTYPKIQTFQTKQWFFMKPFQLVSLKIETSAHVDNQEDASLPIISLKEVHELEQLKQNARSEINDQPMSPTNAVHRDDEVKQQYQIKWRDLNLYAVTSFSMVPILLGISVVYNRLDDILPKHYLTQLVSRFSQQTETVIIFDIVFVILLAVVISYLLIIQRYYHFKIVQHGTQLTTNKGFFQTSRVTVRLNRIQSVVYIQSWLRQLLHLTTVQALVAANASDDEKSGGVVIMPVVQSKDVQQQMHAFIDWLPIQDVTGKSRWRANARGRWALIRNRLLIAALICVPICVFLRPFGLLSLIVLPVAWSLGIYTGKKTEIGVTGEKILVAQVGRLFGKKRYYMPRKNIQSMQLSQSILMRQTGLVHLVIRLRSGNTELSIKIRYLPEQDAKAVYAWYRQAYLQ